MQANVVDIQEMKAALSQKASLLQVAELSAAAEQKTEERIRTQVLELRAALEISFAQVEEAMTAAAKKALPEQVEEISECVACKLAIQSEKDVKIAIEQKAGPRQVEKAE